MFFFFFFQAEDGIRDFHVTGVQTCALPICPEPRFAQGRRMEHAPHHPRGQTDGGGDRRPDRDRFHRRRSGAGEESLVRAGSVSAAGVWLHRAAKSWPGSPCALPGSKRAPAGASEVKPTPSGRSAATAAFALKRRSALGRLRAVMKVAIVLGLLWASLPLAAVSSSGGRLEHVSLFGAEYVRLEDWARAHDF